MSVRRVSEERWREAQVWERALWEEGQQKQGWRRFAWPVLAPVLRALGWRRAWGDDWNHWWGSQFDQYSFLPEDIGEMIELGCGPYTNTRLILRDRTAQRVICSDPLATTYVTFRGRWLAAAAASGRVEIDTHPIEECPFAPGSFDVVVMINVLDHVLDADRCMQVATGLVRVGGILILGQDLSDARDIEHHPYDVGHPIRLSREDLDPYLTRFEPVLRRDLVRAEGRAPDLHYSTLVFAGRRHA